MKPGPRGLGAHEPAAVEREVGHKRVCYLPRRHAQRPGARHGVIGGKVAVGGVLGYLHHAGERRGLGQLALSGGARLGVGQESVYLSFCLFNKISHLSNPRTFSHIDFKPVPAHDGVVKVYNIVYLQVAAAFAQRGADFMRIQTHGRGAVGVS